jgi:hypothetical protein
MSARSAVKLLLALSIGLPLLQAILFWIGGLLEAMGDEAASGALSRIQMAAGVLWLISLSGLVVVLAVRSLEEDDGPSS